MAEKMSDKYELYLLHLFVGVMYEEMYELIRFGIPPIGVGHATSLEKDLQEKILPLFIKIDEFIKETALKMIGDSVSTKEDENDALQWVNVMLEELKRRVSFLRSSYGKEMEQVTALLQEIDEILNKDIKKDDSSERILENEEK